MSTHVLWPNQPSEYHDAWRQVSASQLGQGSLIRGEMSDQEGRTHERGWAWEEKVNTTDRHWPPKEHEMDKIPKNGRCHWQEWARGTPLTGHERPTPKAGNRERHRNGRWMPEWTRPHWNTCVVQYPQWRFTHLRWLRTMVAESKEVLVLLWWVLILQGLKYCNCDSPFSSVNPSSKPASFSTPVFKSLSRTFGHNF